MSLTGFPSIMAASGHSDRGGGMALQSMTGFARSEGTAAGGLSWVWELRSVNGKSLDIRLRLPNGWEHLEFRLREKVAVAFSRGNVQIILSLAQEGGGVVPVVNEKALRSVLAIIDDLRPRMGGADLSIDGLLNVRGVLEFREPERTEAERCAADNTLLDGFDRALADLARARRSEGAALRDVLNRQLSAIERLAEAVDADPSRDIETVRRRLSEQLALLVGQSSLDPQRLHAEAALLATKADLREEIDRLRAHVASGRDLLNGGGPVGRRLDFLAQEFNREANTICSKSNAASVTGHGMELKVTIDQFREQVQNLE